MDYRTTTKIKPIVDADDGVTCMFKYKSSDPEVVSVDKYGNVEALKRGNATITVTVADQYGNIVTDQYGNAVKDTCTVTVKYTSLQWIIMIFLFGWIWY